MEGDLEAAIAADAASSGSSSSSEDEEEDSSSNDDEERIEETKNDGRFPLDPKKFQPDDLEDDYSFRSSLADERDTFQTSNSNII